MMSNAIYRFGNEKIGYCTVLVKHPPRVENPTPEQIAEVQRNRQRINEALSRIESTAMGQPMEATVDFRDDLYCSGVPETVEELKAITERLESA